MAYNAQKFVSGDAVTFANNNQVLSVVRIQRQAVDPVLGPADVGVVWFNTTTGIQKYWDGTKYIPCREVLVASPATIVNVGAQTTVSVQAATALQNGYLSAADKAKLNTSTNLADPSSLMMRDAAGRSKVTDGVVSDDIATYGQLTTMINNVIKGPEPYDPTITSNFPITYAGNPVGKYDSFRITASGTMGSINPQTVNPEDLLISLVATPSAIDGSDWQVVESNRDQATETLKGVAEIATQAETNTGTDDLRIVTPLKLKTWADTYQLFGNNEVTAVDLTESSTSGATFVQKLSLSTGAVLAGTYYITWTFTWRASNNNGRIETRIQLDNTTDLWNQLRTDSGSGTAVDTRIPVSGAAVVSLSAASHTFDLDWRKDSGGGSVFISQCHMQFWRVA